jgi:hypothetical protein
MTSPIQGASAWVTALKFDCLHVAFRDKIGQLMGKITLNVSELFVCSHAFVSITERANGTEADKGFQAPVCR